MAEPSAREARLSIVLSHPVQHFSPAFRLMASTTDFEVIYGDDNAQGMFDIGFDRRVVWDIDLLSGYPSFAVRPGASVSRAVWRRLSETRPDAILPFGWASVAARTAIVWSIVHRRPFFLYGDSTVQHSSSGRQRFGRRSLLQVLCHQAAGALSTGFFNSAFYVANGMAPERIWPSCYPADISLFGSDSDARPKQSTVAIGYSGKLIDRKGVDELLVALALLPSTLSWRAKIIGTGPKEQDLRRWSEMLGLGDRVDFVGFRNQSEMPDELANCDIVVVPSTRDFRVLVAAEAMASRAAVIVSSNTAVWGPGDLIEHRRTGLVYASGQPVELAAQIEALVADVALRNRLIDEGSKKVGTVGPASFADSVQNLMAGLGPRTRRTTGAPP